MPYAAAAASRIGLFEGAPRGDPPLGIRSLVAALAPYAATSRFVMHAAAAERSAASFVGELVRDLAPRLRLFASLVRNSSNSAIPSATGSNSAIPSATGSNSSIGAPRNLYGCATGFTSNIGAPRNLYGCATGFTSNIGALGNCFSTAAPLQAHRPFLSGTRFLSTATGPDPDQSTANSRRFRQAINFAKREMVRAQRVRRTQPGVTSLNTTHSTKRLWAKYFGLFGAFLVMSEGVREADIRYRQLSDFLRWLRETGAVDDSILVGDNFSWIFD